MPALQKSGAGALDEGGEFRGVGRRNPGVRLGRQDQRRHVDPVEPPLQPPVWDRPGVVGHGAEGVGEPDLGLDLVVLRLFHLRPHLAARPDQRLHIGEAVGEDILHRMSVVPESQRGGQHQSIEPPRRQGRQFGRQHGAEAMPGQDCVFDPELGQDRVVEQRQVVQGRKLGELVQARQSGHERRDDLMVLGQGVQHGVVRRWRRHPMQPHQGRARTAAHHAHLGLAAETKGTFGQRDHD